MSEIIFMVEEAPEGGYTARALGESIFAEAESLEDLREQVRDAVKCHFDEGEADGLTPRLVLVRMKGERGGEPTVGRATGRRKRRQ